MSFIFYFYSSSSVESKNSTIKSIFSFSLKFESILSSKLMKDFMRELTVKGLEYLSFQFERHPIEKMNQKYSILKID